ncbi:multidrug ABC transporter permease [Virgisporangium aliadipatigenens]|uniref:Multidrug ABC transporter permease n=1 Tax=Virgisporangium aliadipatigenens TaxID=741659 RepID=A0A8J3YGP4_9ACTN|nr:ABC transporter ATP-binding protein [Virgisporangium aliadipatigenens]GIJ43641.1 multidrug ABC transporter permease [Virgisporangium aliadipatigenens]
MKLPVATARQTWTALGAEFRRLPVRTGAAFVTVVAASAAGLVAPWVLGRMVDDIARGASHRQIVHAALIVAGAAAVGGLLTALGSVLVARLGETVLARVRERVVDRALHVPSAVVEKAGTGDLVARAGDDVAVVTRAITTTGPDMVGAVLTVVLTAFGLLALDWRLCLAGLAAGPVYVFALRSYLPRSAPLYARQREVTSERTQALVGALRGVETVHAYRLEGTQLRLVTERSQAAVDVVLRVLRMFFRFTSWISRAEFLGLSLVLVTGFLLVQAGQTTVGATTAAALYFHRLFNPIGLLVFEFDTIQQAGASLARLVGVTRLAAPAEPAPDAPVPADTGLDLAGLHYRYDGGPPVLRDVTLRIAPGERVALVGASGAGKTTLAGIAGGILAATDGSVRLGGVDLSAFGEREVRRRICVVSQEVHVFAGTLLDDVRLARATATEEEAVAALDRVGALGWVRALPDGVHTHVGEGGHELTAAQAQHLALARLVLMDPDVAILDEATAEAGSAGARELERAAAAATAGRTTLVVAHRLTQAAGADRVVLLDHGAIAEVGTHEELLDAGGFYSRLWHGWTAAGTRVR